MSQNGHEFNLTCSYESVYHCTIFKIKFYVLCHSYHRQGAGESVVRGDPISGNPRPPPYLSNHAKITATKLAQEAKETVVAVHKILNVQGLQTIWCVHYF